MKYNHLAKMAASTGLVLGSGSPRRFRLLTETGIAFEQITPQLEEIQLPGEPPYDYARRLAADKARWVSERTDRLKTIIGCDTIVVLEDRVMEKPKNESEAFNTLTTLAGQCHTVCTAVALARRGKVMAEGRDLTRVYFNPITAEQIRRYIKTGEPMDKAGAYGIQGMGAFLVDRIEGFLDNVVGLPRQLLNDLTGQLLDLDEAS